MNDGAGLIETVREFAVFLSIVSCISICLAVYVWYGAGWGLISFGASAGLGAVTAFVASSKGGAK